ncbi:reverse transcriptase domain-containing protein, partial [Tanacetum coccineum]
MKSCRVMIETCLRIPTATDFLNGHLIGHLSLLLAYAPVALKPVMWDVNSATGRYLSTDFIVSDEKGNFMHCTARGNIAHNFLRLKEGAIYSVKNFTVQPNKDDFRVLRFAHFILEMDGDTFVCRSAVKSNGFACYPFQLVEFDSLEPTNNKYLIGKDLNSAVGYITNIGRTTTTRSGSKTLDFHLANNRGQSVRVTLWGGLGEMLIEKRTRHVGLYLVVLTALSVKLYNSKPYFVYQFPAVTLTLYPVICFLWHASQLADRLYLSSTSSTMIVDDEQIPVKNCYRQIAQIALICHPCFQAATFHYAVRVDKIRTKRGWNYPSCGGEKCKKCNLDCKHDHFWCDSCHGSVDFPVLRYRLELEVPNDTAQTVVVMFDETTRAVVNV